MLATTPSGSVASTIDTPAVVRKAMRFNGNDNGHAACRARFLVENGKTAAIGAQLETPAGAHAQGPCWPACLTGTLTTGRPTPHLPACRE